MSDMNMTEAEVKLDDEKLRAEVSKLIAETTKIGMETRKLNKEIKWYEVIILAGGASALTLAIVAVTKIFL